MFTIRGVPYGQKVTRSRKKERKKNQGDKWNKKMGGRSCFITSGAFGHGLLCIMGELAGVGLWLWLLALVTGDR